MTINIKSVKYIGTIESNNDAIISFYWILCDINLRGLNVVNKRKAFKNCNEEVVFPDELTYLANKL